MKDVCSWDISSTGEKKSRSVRALRGFFHLSIRAMTELAQRPLLLQAWIFSVPVLLSWAAIGVCFKDVDPA